MNDENILTDPIITPFVDSYLKNGYKVKKAKFLDGITDSPCDKIDKCLCGGSVFTFIKGFDVVSKCAHCKKNY